jgi:probable HAF family extracellular repeat protein
VIDLVPVPGAIGSQANAIAAIHAAGYSILSDQISTRATFWHDGLAEDLGAGVANAINSSDQIASYIPQSDGTSRATLWDHGLVTDLGMLPGGFNSSQATGINDSGEIVGTASLGTGFKFAGFKWTAKTGMQPIPGAVSVNAVKRSGAIAGEDTNSHAAIFTQETETDLGLFALFAEATAVNKSGQAVGISPPDFVRGVHAFFYPGGGAKIQDLGTFTAGGDDTVATGISNSGLVVGYDLNPPEGALRAGSARLLTPHPHFINYNTTLAFIWTAKTGLIDLNTLISASSGWKLSGAFGIDHNGAAIVGAGVIGEQVHGFMLVPGN